MMRMKILLEVFAIIALLMTANIASADWVRYADNEDGDDFYLDPATIRREGHIRIVWEIQDFKRRDSLGELSRRGLREYDCKQQRLRSLSITFHSERMGKGKVLYSSNATSEWNYFPPGSASAIALRLLCAK